MVRTRPRMMRSRPHVDWNLTFPKTLVSILTYSTSLLGFCLVRVTTTKRVRVAPVSSQKKIVAIEAPHRIDQDSIRAPPHQKAQGEARSFRSTRRYYARESMIYVAPLGGPINRRNSLVLWHPVMGMQCTL